METLTIAGNTLDELADVWQKGCQEYLRDTCADHEIDPDGEIPAELLNTSEQETWNWMRSEFGAFGFDAEAEEKVAEIIEDRRNA